MTIQDFLVMLDPKGRAGDPTDEYLHEGGCNGGKDVIMNQIRKDAEVVAYGVCAGTGAVITRARKALYAYVVRNMGYPVVYNQEYKQYHWRRMCVPGAIEYLRSHTWEQGDWDRDIDYIDNPPVRKEWKEIHRTRVNIIVKPSGREVFETYEDEMSLIRTKTGRLRVEFSEDYTSAAEVGVGLSRLETLPPGATPSDVWHHCSKIYRSNGGSFVLYSYEDIPDDLVRELILISMRKKLSGG